MRLTLLLIAGLALSGCVSTVGTLDSAPDRLRLNERAARQAATVALVSGETFRAHGFRVDADEASWTNPATGEVQTFARGDVARVRFLRRGQGVLDGAALGAASGFATGAVGVLALCGERRPSEAFGPDPCSAESRLAGAALTGVVTGVVGGVLGALTGPVVSNKLVWEGTPRRP